MSDTRFKLRGNNWVGFNCRQSGELVLGGPAGTGKTYAALLHLLRFAEQYPGARIAVVRKTRVSLTESALVTWERILGPSHPALARPISRGSRHQYTFPNGSVVITAGMDRPDKVLSTEWDLIYVNECTDLTLLDWETLAGRLRAGAGPYDLILGDCNPTTPAHWLYKRHLAGSLTLLSTSHRDNPHYWDKGLGRWTEAGRRYVVERLGRMTGSRRKRFLEGLWEAAEGLVYDGFDRAVHLLPVGWEPPPEWRRVWAIDWGFRDPTVILFFAMDPSNRMHLYREIYTSHTRVEVLAKRCRKLVDDGVEPEPSSVLADHDPEAIETFKTHGRFPVRSADKRDRDGGFQVVQGLLDIAADGRPKLFFRPDARRDPPCPHLEGAGRPTSTLEELIGYTWDTRDPERPKDEPIAWNDHAMDALRYGCVHVHNLRPLFYTGETTP